MKTILSKISDEQAKNELSYLPTIIVVMTVLSLFAVEFLVGPALLFSGRGVLITYHKGLANRSHLIWYRILFAVCAIIPLIKLVVLIIW